MPVSRTDICLIAVVFFQSDVKLAALAETKEVCVAKEVCLLWRGGFACTDVYGTFSLDCFTRYMNMFIMFYVINCKFVLHFN